MTPSRAARRGRTPELTDRHTERQILDRFVDDVRGGEGRALVVRGEPGVGKTVLLEYLAGRASGCRVARAAGVQSEMELAFPACTSCAPRCWTGPGPCRPRSTRRRAWRRSPNVPGTSCWPPARRSAGAWPRPKASSPRRRRRSPRLAVRGRTNAEIGAQLFIKLGITSRRELARALTAPQAP